MDDQDKTPACEVRTRLNYRTAPMEILESTVLSFSTRVLLTWILMHGNSWKFRIGFALRQCGISERSWRKVSGELKSAGFFTQERGRSRKVDGGRLVFEWKNVITDEPLFHPSTMHVSKNAHMQNAGMQGAGMQKGGITEPLSNRNRVHNLPNLSTQSGLIRESRLGTTLDDEHFPTDEFFDAPIDAPQNAGALEDWEWFEDGGEAV